jgi:hypothetical protein
MGVAVPELAENVGVEHLVVEPLRVRHRDLRHQSAHLLGGRPRQRETSQRSSDERHLDDDPEHPERDRDVAGHAERRPDQHEPPDTVGCMERVGRRDEPDERAAGEIDALQLEPV